jgi:hypothetical protein
MYCMEHLLLLLTVEQAKKLQFRAGTPPIIASEDEQHALQGPPLTDDVLRLLRSVASSRQMRDLRKCGAVQFVYALPDRSPFLVRAKMDDATVVFEIS